MKRSKVMPGRERGAVAVEFALIAPVLLLIVVSILEFSHFYNLQISVTQAAREAAREMSVSNDVGLAAAKGVAGAPGVAIAPGNFAFSGACVPGDTVTATVTFTQPALTGFFRPTVTVTGQGAMRCERLTLTEARRAKDNEKGAAGVLVAVMMLVLIGVGAIAVDVGQIYAERAELQNAADAGALAGAQICSETAGCTQADADAVAALLANQNSKDGVSRVRFVDLSVPFEVTVSTATVNGANGTGFLSKLFGSALNTADVGVGATATAKWEYPTKGRSILPLTFAPCEFIDDGLPHKILTQGGGTADCNGLNPSNQIIPGGFAWLNPDGNTGCEVTAEINQWSKTSAGAAMPAGCGAVFNSGLVGKTVAIPVYKYTCKNMFSPCTGSNVQYFIEKWAGFEVLGWRFPGNSHDPTNVFTTSQKGLYGTFVGYFVDSSLFTGGSTTSYRKHKSSRSHQITTDSFLKGWKN